MKKYYFICYAFKYRGLSNLSFHNFLSDKNPLEWQINVRKNNDGDYSLISWSEITEEEYTKHKPNW